MSKKLWGGRFKKKTDPLVEEFTKSIDYDQRLAEYDLIGSQIHVKVLQKSGYLTAAEANKLIGELNFLSKKIINKTFKPNPIDEDIHTCIQNEVQKKIGGLALKLHTARSRNDQVVFATKLYCVFTLKELELMALELVNAIAVLMLNNHALIIPGFTHMQHAQPVFLGDYLKAYVEMLQRDVKRFVYISDNMSINMGAGALAGTPIASSQYKTITEKVLKGSNLKKFTDRFHIKAVENSLDAVSDRDFVIEIINALAIAGMHLSRFAEDLIIWSTKEFDFVEIDESFCTGSSLMPQKKNPDVLELIRGYAGRLNGNLISVLTMMKGLPLTYNRDMQLDKEPLFNSFDIVSMELKVLTGLVRTLKFNEDKIKAQLEDESLYATDIVYYLVDRGIPFKEAHTIVGKLVKYSIDNSIKIQDMPEPLLKKFTPKFVKEGRDGILRLFDPRVSVESKKSIARKK